MKRSVAPRVDRAPAVLARVFQQEDLNFLITNRIPRRLATRAMARFARIRSRRLTRLSLRLWRLFADDLRLEEAHETDFESVRDCFVRRLKPGLRPIDADPNAVTSPCDAVIGAHGAIADTQLIQAKGLGYTLEDLLGDPQLAARFRHGTFITLRLQASMYHHFHAPCDGRIRGLTYIAGDTWNVNPIALARVERLFCRNERAVVEIAPVWPNTAIAMVPVAAILVGGIHFAFQPLPLNLQHRGRRWFACDTSLTKGEAIGHFEAGSTILLLLAGAFRFAPGVQAGMRILVGRPLLHYRTHSAHEGGCPS